MSYSLGSGLRLAAIATVAAGIAFSDAEAASISPLADASAFSSVLNARWRNLDGSADAGQMYLEKGEITPPPDVQGFAQLSNAASSKPFSFSYDGTTARMAITDKNGVSKAISYVYGNLAPFDDLLFIIRTQNDVTITLADLVLNGSAITGGPISASSGFSTWLVQNAFANSTFTLEGTYSTSAAVGSSQEAWRFEVKGGNAPNPVPVPAAIPLFLSGLAAVGVISRRRQPA